ncbi:leader peptidase (prepilin peptidase) / N-methyltransferase [Sinosporangium album]|uniref:Leader peptidase (Prepilin peptidase) / N-methyltransferase n=1 Tax=Sinosporangium album TaxID=504805 RepID=A0A1G7R8T7_9ACTN|nr:A24 family peptidase [Sinosporangium album]SDG07157.1 leader peptidase (prepilin peptidase) / N-methyltransferase [Sinosporangium album]
MLSGLLVGVLVGAVAAGLLGAVAGRVARGAAAGFGDEPGGWAEFRGAFRAPALRGRGVGVELVTGVMCAAVVWRFSGLWPYAPAGGAAVPYGAAHAAAGLYAVVAGVLLALVDRRTHRLPDTVTLPSYLVLAALIAVAGDLGPALAGGLALGGIYFVLWWIRPAALGLGDVKLAGLIGMVCGMLGAQAWTVAALGGQLLGALYGVGLVLRRRATMTTEFAFGPFLLLGGLTGVLIP